MKRIATFIAFSIVLVSCGAAGAVPDANLRTVTLLNGGSKEATLTVELADTPMEWEQGLMYRKELERGTGMLFSFQEERPMTFWMKNTLIPLDILFFNSQRQFVSAASMVPCTADPCTVYRSAGPALYALEVNAGFVEQYGVTQGWTMEVGGR